MASVFEGKSEHERLVAYDDCGVPMRDPHVARGVRVELDRGRVPRVEIKKQREYMVASDPERVELKYERLDPQARYTLAVKWGTEEGAPRRQRVIVSGRTLHEGALPEGELEILNLPVPAECLSSGTLVVAVENVSGPGAIVSEVALWCDRGWEALTFYVSGDVRGRLIGCVGDPKFAPAPGCKVVVSALETGRRVEVTTDDLGFFAIPVESLAPSRKGSVRLVAERVRAGDVRQLGEAKIDLSDIPLGLEPLPAAVESVGTPVVPLDGLWKVGEPVPGCLEEGFDDSGWLDNESPGHWVTQGFAPAGGVGVHRRWIDIPADFAGRRILLRFDAVYSQAEVYVNGKKCGGHVGGATAFTVDATEAARPGARNLVALVVREYTDASILDYMSWYAHMPLAGIWRQSRIACTPWVHLGRLHVETRFDAAYVDAQLSIEAEVANAGGAPVQGVSVEWILRSDDGSETPLAASEAANLGSFERLPVRAEARIPSPKKWDAEHPNLYTLVAVLRVGGREEARYERRFGFRQVEVRDRRILVNGRKVTLRGVNRHDGYIKRGRALTEKEWAKDIELLLDANVNAVRTSHYPAAEAFLEMCDEAGIYVQEATPICFAGGWSASRPMEDAYGLPRMMQVVAELIERDKSHPSVIIWDLANESEWGPNFQRVHELLRKIDPTRPSLFSHDRDITPCEVRSLHYPGGTVFGLEPGVDRIKQSPRPVVVDEYGAVFQSCQSWILQTGELALDPGLRDFWVTGTRFLWEEMRKVPNCAGGMIWTWGDDYFHATTGGKIGVGNWSFIPGNRFKENIELARVEVGQIKGEGEWGVVDGWLRPRPEWWHTKKMYSPVKASLAAAASRSLVLEIENRFDSTDLSDVEASWTCGSAKGTVELAGAPGETVRVEIEHGEVAPGAPVEVEFRHRRSRRLIDLYRFPAGGAEDAVLPVRSRQVPFTSERRDGRWRAARGDWSYAFDRSLGGLQVSFRGRPVLLGGPVLHVLPLIGGRSLVPVWDNRWPEHVAFDRDGESGILRISTYYDFFRGGYEVRIEPDGAIRVAYRFDVFGQQSFDAREVGLRFTLPDEFEELWWHRDGEWNAYPPDHIGRTRGRAKLNAGTTSPLSPRESWSMERTANGSNDFRSSKRNVRWAALTAADGRGLGVVSDGRQHVRVEKVHDGIALHVNDFFGGASSYFNAEAWIPAFGLGRRIDRTVVLEGAVTLLPFEPGDFSADPKTYA